MTDVVMPQMGESIAEGTIVRWIKKVGDQVDRDEPLFEISTDKVDAEIPSPAAGVVSEIRVKEGETVPVNSVVAVIGGAREAVTAPTAPPAAPSSAAPPPTSPVQTTGTVTPLQRPEAPVAADAERVAAPAGGLEATLRERSSPLVRKIAKEHSVDISQIQGTGIAGRVTKDDILGFIEQTGPARKGAPPTVARGGAERGGGAVAPAVRGAAAPESAVRGAGAPGLREDVVEKMSVMRKRIA